MARLHAQLWTVSVQHTARKQLTFRRGGVASSREEGKVVGRRDLEGEGGRGPPDRPLGDHHREGHLVRKGEGQVEEREGKRPSRQDHKQVSSL